MSDWSPGASFVPGSKLTQAQKNNASNYYQGGSAGGSGQRLTSGTIQGKVYNNVTSEEILNNQLSPNTKATLDQQATAQRNLNQQIDQSQQNVSRIYQQGNIQGKVYDNVTGAEILQNKLAPNTKATLNEMKSREALQNKIINYKTSQGYQLTPQEQVKLATGKYISNKAELNDFLSNTNPGDTQRNIKQVYQYEGSIINERKRQEKIADNKKSAEGINSLRQLNAERIQNQQLSQSVEKANEGFVIGQARRIIKQEQKVAQDRADLRKTKIFGVPLNTLDIKPTDSNTAKTFKALGNVGTSLFTPEVIATGESLILTGDKIGLGITATAFGYKDLIVKGDKTALKSTENYFKSGVKPAIRSLSPVYRDETGFKYNPEGTANLIVAGVGAFGVAGAKAVSNKPQVFGDIKVQKISTEKITTQGGQFDIRQNIPRATPEEITFVQYKDLVGAKFLPKADVSIKIIGDLATESRTYLGRTSTKTYSVTGKQTPINLNSIELGITRNPPVYLEGDSVAIQQTKSLRALQGKAYFNKKTDIQADFTQTTYTFKKDIAGKYAIAEQSGYKVDFKGFGLQESQAYTSLKLTETGLGKVKISKAPTIFNERINSALTGKEANSVFGSLSDKGAVSTTLSRISSTKGTLKLIPAPKESAFTYLIPEAYSRYTFVNPKTSLLTNTKTSFISELKIQPSMDSLFKIPSNLAQSGSRAINPVLISNQNLIQSTKTSLISKVDIISDQKIKTTQKISPIFKLDIIPVRKISLVRETTPVQKVTQRPNRITTKRIQPIFEVAPPSPIPFKPNIRPPVIKEEFIPIIPPVSIFPGNKATSGAYNVFVKDKKRLVKVNTKPLDQRSALNFMDYVIDNSTARTGTIRKTTGSASSQNLGFFSSEKYKNSGSNFIEKTPYLINTQGELRGITYKGLLAQSFKKKTWGMKR